MKPLLSPVAPDAAPAVWDAATERWVSYGELRRAVEGRARQLRQPRKQLVMLFAANALTDLVCYLAAMAVGHAVMLCDAAWSTDWKKRAIQAYEPDWIVGAGDRAESQAGYESDAGVPGDPILHRSTGGPAAGVHADLSLLLCTSGSTGSSKYVRLSAENVSSNAESISAALQITAGDRALLALPMHYSYGLSVVNSHLMSGASLVLTPAGMLEPEFWRTAALTEATSVACVPFQVQLLHRLGAGRIESSRVRTVTQAGGRLSSDLVQWGHRTMDAIGGRFLVMYGQTEATARISVLPHEEIPARPTSVGRPVPGGSLAIADPVEAGGVGEIEYRGPNVMLGYAHGRDDLARGDDCAGRLRTGDLGYIDRDGFLFLTGRIKRVIKLSGKRVNLDEVETLLAGPLVVAAVGRDEELSLVVEGDDAQDEVSRLALRVARLIGVPPPAVRVRVTQNLPRLSNGKIDYAALQESL